MDLSRVLDSFSQPNAVIQVSCRDCGGKCAVSIAENDEEVTVLARGSLALSFADWASDAAARFRRSEINAKMDPYNGMDTLTARADAVPYEHHFRMNSRKAMRVLEDYLCLEVMKDAKKASTSSLKVLRKDAHYKDDFEKMMNKYGLTKPHLNMIRRRKKGPEHSTYPHFTYDAMVAWCLSEESILANRLVLKRLFELLADFTKEKHGYDVVKSPIFDDANDSKFDCRGIILCPSSNHA